jgi:cellulose biosynthesis protein BcsQ
MAVLCFSSLKGGVGKTTLSVSVAGAFAKRGCETLLIDLDPAEHASRFFDEKLQRARRLHESPLARLFLGYEFGSEESDNHESIVEKAMEVGLPLISPVRERLALLPAGPELRHFLWGKGAQVFKSLFPRLLDELNCSYDYVIIDTPPDYNVLTRNSIASSELVVVPVDSSAMSIHCLEELVDSCAHIKGPIWSIVRTMVNRQASRVHQLSTERLQENLFVRSSDDCVDEDDFLSTELADPDRFFSMLDAGEADAVPGFSSRQSKAEQPDSPIYLLNSSIYRTEQQNRLTFLGKTAFDLKSTVHLANQYLTLARELEQMLSMASELGADSFPLIENLLPQQSEDPEERCMNQMS